MSVPCFEVVDDPPVVDLRLLVPALTAWGVAFVSTSVAARWSGIACVIGVLGFVGALLIRRRLPMALCAALVAASASGGLHVAALGAGPLPALARQQQRVAVQATVATDPAISAGKAVGSQLRPDLVILRGTVTALILPRPVSGLHSPVLMLVTGDTERWMALSPSQRLVVDGRLAPPEPGDDITAVLTARGPPHLVGRPTAIERVAGSIRSGLRKAVSGQSADVRGLLPGLVLGDVSRMDPTLTDDFRTAGLTHLVAVSGANVAILFAVVLALTRLVRIPPRPALVASAAVLVAFVVLVRPTPSVLRAAAMAGLLVTAALTGRLRHPMSALLGAVLLLVLVDPELSRSAGFALSTVATAALLVIAPRWAVVLRRHLPRRLADSLAVATAAQLACGPLIAVLSGQVSLVSVPANLLAEPAVPFATVLGVLAAVTAPVAMPLARIFATCAGLPTRWLVVVARHAAHAPYATIAWQQSAAGGLGLALLTVVVVAAARHRRWRRVLGATVVGLLVAVLALRLTAGPWASPGWVFVACDVGQGDGLVLNAGSAAIVVDAGPDPAKMKGCLDHLGVHHVGLVVLSHLHADHVEGLPGVLAGRQVDAIDVGPLAEPVGESHRVLGWAAAAGVPVHHLVAGDVALVGDLTASVLAPLTVLHGTDSDPNNDSLVLRVVLPAVSILLTGDMEQVAQQQLLASGARLDADILKVPHHGSRNQDYALLAATGASVAITSVGTGNTYGHPAPATMAEVSADGMHGFRTDRDGAVEVDTRGGAVTVEGHNGSGTAGSGHATQKPPSAQRPHGQTAGEATFRGTAVVVTDPGRPGQGRPGRGRPAHSDRSPWFVATRACLPRARSPPTEADDQPSSVIRSSVTPSRAMAPAGVAPRASRPPLLGLAQVGARPS